MNQVLSVSMRPRRFSELVGQKAVITTIMNQIASGRIPRSWMFHGPSGVGKTTIARIVALSMQGPMATFGEPSDDLLANAGDYAIHEINASQVNGVDDLRRLAEESQYLPPPPSKKRVYILDEAQRISDAAQNLLLKHFEDTPESTVWIICTTHPQKVLPTLRRRCFSLAVPPLSDIALTRLLKRAANAVGLQKPIKPLKEQLDLVGIYSPGLVLMAVERYASGLSAQASVKTGDTELDSLRICRAFVRGDWPLIRKELKNAGPEDARMLRLAIMGYLRSILLSDNPSIPPVRIAASLKAFAGPGPIEDPAYLSWVAALIYLESQKYK